MVSLDMDAARDLDGGDVYECADTESILPWIPWKCKSVSEWWYEQAQAYRGNDKREG